MSQSRTRMRLRPPHKNLEPLLVNRKTKYRHNTERGEGDPQDDWDFWGFLRLQSTDGLADIHMAHSRSQLTQLC